MMTPPNPDRAALRRFGLVLGALVAGWFGLLMPLAFAWTYRRWPWLAGGGVAVLALAWPAALRPLQLLWHYLGLVLAWVNTRILLFLVYILVITPIGLVLRLAGKDPLNRRLDPSATTYRKLTPLRPSHHLERPY